MLTRRELLFFNKRNLFLSMLYRETHSLNINVGRFDGFFVFKISNFLMYGII